MLARYVQKGDSIDYRPTTDIAAGDVIVISDLIGIARLDIAANTLGSLSVVGVYDVVKAAGQVSAGAAVFWDAGAQKATTVSGSNHYLGKAILAAEAEGETVRVLLNSTHSSAAPFTPGDPITDITDNSGGTASDTLAPLGCEYGGKHAVASLAAKVNKILVALRAVGIIGQ